MNKVISKEIFIKNKIKTPKYLNIKKSYLNKTFIEKIIKKKKLTFQLY